MITATKEKWLSCYNHNANATRNLICFPFGGGGASTYRSWASKLPSNIQVWAVQLPGRENRFKEPFETNPEKVLNAIYAEIVTLRLANVVLFGHSMGSDIAVAIATMMVNKSSNTPHLLIVSGNHPPCEPLPELWADRPDEPFLRHVIDLGGIPDDVLEVPGFLEFYKDKIRADYKLYESLPRRVPSKLPIPIIVTYGRSDKLLEGFDMRNWDQYSEIEVEYVVLEGGHFHLQSNEDELLAAIRDAVDRYIPSAE